MNQVIEILRMIKFSHTLFALPFAMLSAVMAWLQPPAPAWHARHLLGIVLCMVCARSAAMAFNRLADQTMDGQNPRTAMRHLPSGKLRAKSVWLFCLGMCLGFVASTALFWPNKWPLFLSVPVLLFLMGYSYAKRFTPLAHAWLGAALMLAPVCAWVALRGELAWPPVLLGLAVLLWVTGFDVIYACQDFEFDRQHGLRSIPAWLGIPWALRAAAVLHLGMLAVLVCVPLVYNRLGWPYYAAVAAAAVLLTWEHLLVRPGDLSKVNIAFFNINAVLSMGLFLVGSLDCWW